MVPLLLLPEPSPTHPPAGVGVKGCKLEEGPGVEEESRREEEWK